jgi:nucleoside 2-deoxyribosyltransferase
VQRVYLCGPISGRSEREIREWRKRAHDVLSAIADVWDPAGFPMDRNRPNESDPNLEQVRIQHGRVVLERDRDAVRGAAIILANFAGVTEASVGGIGEIFWADAFQVPVVLVRDRATIYNHSMLTAIADAVFDDLDSALKYTATRLRRRR